MLYLEDGSHLDMLQETAGFDLYLEEQLLV